MSDQDPIVEVAETKEIKVSTGKAGTDDYKEETIQVPILNAENYVEHLKDYAGEDEDPALTLFKLATQAYSTNLANMKRREMITPEGTSIMSKIRKADPEKQAQIMAMLEELGL